MDENYLQQIRDVLLKSIDDQYAVDKDTLETNQRLGQQKLMYTNDARGTLYSGQPTWERAQLAANGIQSRAKLDSNYMANKLNVWNNITNTIDKINSYNKAAKALTDAATNNSYSKADWLALYNNL